MSEYLEFLKELIQRNYVLTSRISFYCQKNFTNHTLITSDCSLLSSSENSTQG